ncbi:F-box only protein 6 isoform X2 [Pteropus medius]|uniref:F-box only protein 6 isoform X2 n=1 Tax=Pteropus vampyrus TaxID=132908 RepID=UPI00196B93C2|nr:F-box only protein 6 isoform X2 [Pteropus giganteus]
MSFPPLTHLGDLLRDLDYQNPPGKIQDTACVCFPPTPAMALFSINELPENFLLEVFTHVPARHLLRCRRVCSLWRDLIDVQSLWKRKSLRKGFITKDWNEPVANWKIFFFLCSLRRNLLRNPCAEDDMTSWKIDFNGGNRWKVETLPGAHGTDFPDSKVEKYFVTSFALCLKSQLVDLKAEGYWEELLDTFRPDIVVKDWHWSNRDNQDPASLDLADAHMSYLPPLPFISQVPQAPSLCRAVTGSALAHGRSRTPGSPPEQTVAAPTASEYSWSQPTILPWPPSSPHL